MRNLIDDLKGVLVQEKRFLVEGGLMKNKIIVLALQLNPV
jgi:hypothetical protein